MIGGMMARSALFVNDKDIPKFPTPLVASDILSLHKWEFPTLSSVVSTPVLCKDGTVLTSPGYDKTSGLYYQPSPGLIVPEIKEEPTKDDAIEAAQYIMTEVFGDFPIIDQSSQANALAALMTPLARPVITSCTPLFLVDKPAPGTGASLLVELISNVVLGKSPDFVKQSNNDEEMRKQITSWLRTAPQIIAIDNIDASICSTSLSSALTSLDWGDRIPGHSKVASLPNLASWYATGNNILLGGDIPRRSCLIRMDAKVAKPWERDSTKFKHPNIKRWVRDNRGGDNRQSPDHS
jgi:hypothetical protein